jgi:hypothetical protein
LVLSRPVLSRHPVVIAPVVSRAWLGVQVASDSCRCQFQSRGEGDSSCFTVDIQADSWAGSRVAGVPWQVIYPPEFLDGTVAVCDNGAGEIEAE